ncbi:uncharacterized protein LOC130799325 [Amaranthus tricolor]|uniref:uncharacterized protein LOC130799325 n=1 Tax=Amaranthus tricolor TaxID=29722 RepID=UPI002586F017|nr:uncharacterized protein LOC130799325 [Amaranthus tricolor]
MIALVDDLFCKELMRSGCGTRIVLSIFLIVLSSATSVIEDDATSEFRGCIRVLADKAIDGVDNMPEGISASRWEEIDTKALSALQLCLSNDVLRENLLSLGTLDKIGCKITCEGGVMKVANGSLVVMKGKLNGSLYALEVEVESSNVDDEKDDDRVVAKGYSQIEGVDFHEVFSPVVKHSSIRALLALVAMEDLELHQLDVKTAFLHGELEEEIFMKQPEGFEVAGKENHVCRLKRSLYGLKQSPRQWYKRFDSFMISHDFIRSSYDSCVYFKKFEDGSLLYLLLYVDDMLATNACNNHLPLEATCFSFEVDHVNKRLRGGIKMGSMIGSSSDMRHAHVWSHFQSEESSFSFALVKIGLVAIDFELADPSVVGCATPYATSVKSPLLATPN